MSARVESDWHPLLLTRVWPQSAIADAFDAWEVDKHIPELMRASGVVLARWFRHVLEGLPSAWRGYGTRMAYYTSRDVDGLLAFISSDEAAAAVQDGNGWFDRFNELDFEPYTGNICPVLAVENRSGSAPDVSLPVLVERFEVGDGDVDEFDAWLLEKHLPAIGAHRGVVRARAFAAVREGSALPYYSPGNRTLMAEVSEVATARTPELAAALEDSMHWDRRLTYVKREAYQCLTHASSVHEGPA